MKETTSMKTEANEKNIKKGQETPDTFNMALNFLWATIPTSILITTVKTFTTISGVVLPIAIIAGSYYGISKIRGERKRNKREKIKETLFALASILLIFIILPMLLLWFFAAPQ